MHQHAEACGGMHQHAPACTSMHKHAQACTSMRPQPQASAGLHQHAPACTSVHQRVPARTSMHLRAAVCSSLPQCASVCLTVQQNTTRGKESHEPKLRLCILPRGDLRHSSAALPVPSCVSVKHTSSAALQCARHLGNILLRGMAVWISASVCIDGFCTRCRRHTWCA